MRSRLKEKGSGGLLSDHRQSRGLQGVQSLRRGLSRRRAGHRPAGRRFAGRSCAATGRSGSACPTPTTASSTSPTWMKESACSPRCCSRRSTYRSMVGGDGACMGCGEKTAVHLIVSSIYAAMQPRVKRHVEYLDELIDALDRTGAGPDRRRGRSRPAAAKAERQRGRPGGPGQAGTAGPARPGGAGFKDLQWRYETGPSGHGRAPLGMTNSTGCSSVWGSTYPYNPYPFPWANHLFQDAPSLAIGVFEGHMRKMADGFVAVRRAELCVTGRLRRRAARARVPPASTGSSSPTRSSPSVRRSWRWVATGPCSTSASRTSRGCWPPASRFAWWCWTPRSTRTPAARPAPAATPARWPTCRRGARPSTARLEDAEGTRAHRDGASRRVCPPVLPGLGVAPDRAAS